MKPPASRVLSLFRQPWLMAPDALQDIYDIAARARAPDFEAAAATLAARADRTRAAELLNLRRGIAILPIYGPIFPRANIFTQISGATSIDVLAAAFRQAHADRDVHTILLDVDSPGGAVTGVSEFAAMIKASKKPVIAYGSGMVASAAYWLASAAGRFIVTDTNWSGSVGVVSTYVIDDDESVIEVVSSQSPLKRTDVRTDEGRLIAQAHVDALADVFVDTVATHRNVTRDFVLANFGKGDVLIGGSAVRAGMADGLGTFEDVIDFFGRRPAKPSDELPSLAVLIQKHGYDGAQSVIAAHEKRRLVGGR